jgi:small subunit ribosomal protein S8
MPRESLSHITPEQSMESLGNLLEVVRDNIEGVSGKEVANLDRRKIQEWIEIDQSIERNTEKFVDYRRRAESDPEAATQIAELEREQKALQERAKELVAEFVTELKKLRETESAREEATTVEPAKENKEKQRLLNEAERIKGELSKLFAEVTEYRENLERELEMLDGFEDERTRKAAEETKRVLHEMSRLNNFRDRKRNLEGEHAEFETALSKLGSSEKADFNSSEGEIAGLSVNISDEIEDIQKLEKKIESSRRTKRAATPERIIEVELKYEAEKGAINEIKFLSVPSRRLYSGYKDLRPVRQGFGVAIVSTPKGIMTASEARKQKVGGQLLFEIW